MSKVTDIHIGTSGWHYKHWVNRFYPASLPSGEMFQWYSERFDTVEINNTFYRLPTDDTFRNWREQAPPGFLFSVKGSRFITHMKRLLEPEKSIANFLSGADLLRGKLGPVLFQLPPNWRVNVPRLEEFLTALPAHHRYVFEFRDASWATPAVYELLRHHNAALCMHDWHGISWPRQLTADFTYIRFHGPTGTYTGGYPSHVLADWAGRIRKWSSLKNVFVYFNNDLGGHAVTDALSLRKLLSPLSMAS